LPRRWRRPCIGSIAGIFAHGQFFRSMYQAQTDYVAQQLEERFHSRNRRSSYNIVKLLFLLRVFGP
jgi:hypothetical protein